VYYFPDSKGKKNMVVNWRNINAFSFPQLPGKMVKKKGDFKIFYKEKRPVKSIFADSQNLWIQLKNNSLKTVLKEEELFL
jgi:hypothetical protein